jgi:exodeoxyribonuclease VII large subunit
VLERGFALVRDTEGRMIRLAQEAVAAGTVEVEFADGRLAAEIDPGDSARADTGKSGTKDGPGAPRQRIKKAKEKQGQLL